MGWYQRRVHGADDDVIVITDIYTQMILCLRTISHKITVKICKTIFRKSHLEIHLNYHWPTSNPGRIMLILRGNINPLDTKCKFSRAHINPTTQYKSYPCYIIVI